MKIREHRHEEKSELPMAPMIDIVFQLLVFFIMTFKIVAMEGDFNLKMPKGATSSEDISFDPPLTIELKSDSVGDISEIVLVQATGNKSLDTSFQKLTDEIVARVGTGPQNVAAANTEVIFDCDEFLRYEEAIRAITAVTGYIDGEGNLVRLVENVKFKEHK
jgi:biopolymer transport protein ExbD